jgi:hypothetical protein
LEVDEKNSEFKAQLEKQAAAYRKLAGERANKPGLPSPNNRTETLPRGSSKNIHAGSRVIHGALEQVSRLSSSLMTTSRPILVSASRPPINLYQLHRRGTNTRFTCFPPLQHFSWLIWVIVQVNQGYCR